MDFSPNGHGQTTESSAEFNPYCLVCSAGPFRNLVGHALHKHNLRPEEYRAQTGYSGAMVEPGLRNQMTEASNANHTPERRKKMSATLKETYATTDLKERRRAHAHTSWNTTRKLHPLTQLRRDLVVRAGWACEDCGKSEEEELGDTGKSLNLHHLHYNKTVPSLEEVVLLCRACHMARHPTKKWGSGTFNRVAGAVAAILDALGADIVDDNFLETPRRVATYLMEHFVSEEVIQAEISGMQAATFPSDYAGIVCVSGTAAYGICPHHLLPIEYQIAVAYIPDHLTIGLSKLVRIPTLIAGLPLLQEEVTHRIANELQRVLLTEHVAVSVTGKHMCMSCRGIKAENALTTTSAMRGHFGQNDHGAKQEFFELVKRSVKEW